MRWTTRNTNCWLTEVQAFGAGRSWVDSPARSSKGVIGGSTGFHLVELGYRVVFVRQKKTRPALGQDGLLAWWVGLLWLDECEEPASVKFRVGQLW